MADCQVQTLRSSEECVSTISRYRHRNYDVQQPFCVWLTGLPGAGKSTVARLVEDGLAASGRRCFVLDGDAIRTGLNSDLGFSEADRVENIRRVAEVATLFLDAGIVAIVALISPYRAQREAARHRFEPGEFLEVFVDAPLAVCERRDPKGMYARARRGELANFTGVDSPYEAPDNPEVWLDTASQSAEECAIQLLRALDERASRLLPTLQSR